MKKSRMKYHRSKIELIISFIQLSTYFYQAHSHTHTYTHRQTDRHTHTHIYIYIYIYILPTPVNFKLWGLSTSNLSKHVLTGCEYSLRSYTWRHNEILGIIAEIAKMCCETANEI